MNTPPRHVRNSPASARSLKTSLKRGFTIVETLVAITILMLAITGPMVIISQALKASYFARDQVTAFYLAQEALEYVRNVRDHSALDPTKTAATWLDDISNPSTCASFGTCVNDYQTNTISSKFDVVHTTGTYSFAACDPTDCAPLTYDPSGSSDSIPYGGADASQDSGFRRSLWLTTVPGDPNHLREVVVHVEIDWNQGTAMNSFTLEDHLTNWKLEQ